ncbi:MAG TPA: adenylate/guanylate cyclase domain-containing protein, partial [Solirubrobacterales bacterium]|nr:adenylate/guanylate cyclase domain-containing protein [Solirubrobacterales bacterium]
MPDEPAQPRSRRLVEAARRFNRHPTLLRAARRTRERALGDEEFVEALSDVRGRRSDLAARQLVALRGERPGALGELGLSALQAWQRLAESQDRGRGKVDVAILFTDLVGFSSWALEAGDHSALRLLREVASAIEPPIAANQGEVVKRLGDGLMAAFWSGPDAVEAALEAHERIAPIEVEGYRPQLRTGIHLGRPRKVRR